MPPAVAPSLAALLALVAASTVTHAADGGLPPQPTEENSARVVGGQKARKGEWPWQVKVFAPDPEQRGRFGGHCGGSLIAPTWILTAAHCFSGTRSGQQDLFARDLLVVTGRNRVDKIITVGANDEAALKVADVHLHPQFDRKVFANDIALIELAEPSSAQPVGLAGPDDGPVLEVPGTVATVTGWGYTQANHGWDDRYLPSDLQEVEVPLVSRPTCRAAYRDSSMRTNSIDERNLCAGYPEGGKDACQGDSGGPMVVRHPEGGYAQVGVVSWGAGCAEANRYGVYTRVAAYRDWIAEATRGAVPAGRAAAPIAAMLPAGGEQQEEAAVAQDVAPDAPAAAPNPVSPTPVAGKAGDRALLIGIDDYMAPEAKLDGSAADVEAMRDFAVRTLGYKPEQIRTLVDRRASREAILAAVDDWLVRGTEPGARILFYFSGHGSEIVGPGPVASATLVPADAAIVRNLSGSVTDVSGQIRETEIAARLNGLKDRKVTLVIDACHVGPGSRNAIPPKVPGSVRCLGPALAEETAATPSGPAARFAFGGETAVVWSAVDAGQLALVDTTASPRLGVFTRRFIDGVEGGAARAKGRPALSNAALLDLVRRKSAEFCRTDPDACAFGLVPQLHGKPEALGRDVITGEDPGSTIAAAESTLKTDNPAGVSVAIKPGPTLKPGDRIALTVSARKPGYLILVDIDSTGKLTQVYPNKRSMALAEKTKGAGNRLDPARPVTVPDYGNPYTGFEFRAEGPAGVGMVVAVLSDRPIEVLDLPDVPATLAGQRAAFNYVYDLARNLRIVGEDNGGDAASWSFEAQFYRVR
ncbi:trypsin-like serine protease [Chthonobacter rhizosphaerae]|uniref:trypsin-like serine protease n=1 Tax=Chthonobacter rhizosphaerae TaxID=2735553 RepID=UPI0015EF7E64